MNHQIQLPSRGFLTILSSAETVWQPSELTDLELGVRITRNGINLVSVYRSSSRIYEPIPFCFKLRTNRSQRWFSARKDWGTFPQLPIDDVILGVLEQVNEFLLTC